MLGVKEIWDSIYNQPGAIHKSKYPTESVIRFIYLNFPNNNRHRIKVLDVGCGWGNNLKFLIDEGFDAFGVDCSEVAIDHCKLLKGNVRLCDIAIMPFPGNFFQAVIDRSSIDHNPLEKMFKIVREVHRVLADGGMFFSEMVRKTNDNCHDNSSMHSYLIPNSIGEAELAETSVRDMFSIFSTFQLDYRNISYDGGIKKVSLWNILARK